MNRELYPPVDGTQPCRQVDPEIFFPESGTPVESRIAKEICRSCEYQAPCAAYALTFQVAGIWGGTTEGERRRTRRLGGVSARPLTGTPKASVIRQAERGTPPRVIAETHGLTDRSVHRILKEARRTPSAPAGAPGTVEGAPEDQEAV